MEPIEFTLLPDSAAIGQDGALTVGECSLLDLAAEFGTPAFVYDVGHIRSRCREAVAAFGAGRVVYATKAFLCKAVARLVHDEGMLLDVASGGELHVAMSAGVPASSCTMHGNNKSVDELRMALTAGVRTVVVDSFDELDRLDALHAAAGHSAGPAAPDVLLRITPGVHAHTHEYIATGQDDSKFGFNLATGDAERAVRRASRSASVNLVGFHCHIGSNVFAAASFAKAAAERPVYWDWLPKIAAAHCITSYPVGPSVHAHIPHACGEGDHEDETHLRNGCLFGPWVARSSSIPHWPRRRAAAPAWLGVMPS